MQTTARLRASTCKNFFILSSNGLDVNLRAAAQLGVADVAALRLVAQVAAVHLLGWTLLAHLAALLNPLKAIAHACDGAAGEMRDDALPLRALGVDHLEDDVVLLGVPCALVLVTSSGHFVLVCWAARVPH